MSLQNNVVDNPSSYLVIIVWGMGNVMGDRDRRNGKPVEFQIGICPSVRVHLNRFPCNFTVSLTSGSCKHITTITGKALPFR